MAGFRHPKPHVVKMSAPDRRDRQDGSVDIMTQQPTGFGRRGTPRAAGGSSPAAGNTQPQIGELLRHPRIIVLIPFTIAVVSLIGLGFATNAGLINTPVISTASAVS